MRSDGDKIIAATENGLFYYTPATGEVKKLSKANGLHQVKITAFDYDENTKTGIVGYQSGALDVITPEAITLVVDIPLATGYSGSKKINHISISGKIATISVGYGVSIFNIEKKEFGDTAFFNVNGTFTNVNEAIIKDNYVYAATDEGLKIHATDVTFPIYSTWNSVLAGKISQLAQGTAVFASTESEIFKGETTVFQSFKKGFNEIEDIADNNENVIVADSSSVQQLTENGMVIKNLSFAQKINTAIDFKGQIFSGSLRSGILDQSQHSYKPDGPYSNISYKLDKVGDKIVVATGGRDSSYNDPVIKNLGYYFFDGKQWIYPDFFKNFEGPLNVMDAVINPSNPEEIFFSNYTFVDGNLGIYKTQNNKIVKEYANTGTYYNRIIGFTFDENKQLFASFSDASKIGFYAYDPARDSFLPHFVVNGNSVQKPFAKEGLLYICSPRTGGGLLLYDYKNTPLSFSDDRFQMLREDNNLPSPKVISAALDNDNTLWIGTLTGLRILNNPSQVIGQDTPQTQNIVIEQNGLAEELFRDSSVLQIAVDSGNQKWVSIENGGVYFLSADGQKTLAHFTKANSPLPTDNITDIKIDAKTGIIYFVSFDGIVSYQGDVAEVSSNFGKVVVYPNPVVTKNYLGNVKFKGLAEKTNIRITDAAGNLVHQAVTRGGLYEWNLENMRGKKVASGIYFVLMTNADGSDTATAKIAIVN